MRVFKLHEYMNKLVIFFLTIEKQLKINLKKKDIKMQKYALKTKRGELVIQISFHDLKRVFSQEDEQLEK